MTIAIGATPLTAGRTGGESIDDPLVEELPIKLEMNESEVLEEVSPRRDQLLRQHSPRKAQRWNVRAVLSMFGLGERLLERGKTRARWRRVCGRSMYDDFTELRPGAAAELEKWLGDSMRNYAVSGPSDPPQSASSPPTASPRAGSSRYQSTAESDISLQSLAPSAGTLPGSGGNAAIALDVHLEKCWLLVCGKLKRGPDSLLKQLDLSSTPSDKRLFDEMREFYSKCENHLNSPAVLEGCKNHPLRAGKFFYMEQVPRTRTN